MALEAYTGVAVAHAAAVVDDLDERAAGILDDELYLGGACVEGILEELLDCRGRTVDHLAGGDLVGHAVGQYVDDVAHCEGEEWLAGDNGVVGGGKDVVKHLLGAFADKGDHLAGLVGHVVVGIFVDEGLVGLACLFELAVGLVGYAFEKIADGQVFEVGIVVDNAVIQGNGLVGVEDIALNLGGFEEELRGECVVRVFVGKGGIEGRELVGGGFVGGNGGFEDGVFEVLNLFDTFFAGGTAGNQQGCSKDYDCCDTFHDVLCVIFCSVSYGSVCARVRRRHR